MAKKVYDKETIRILKNCSTDQHKYIAYRLGMENDEKGFNTIFHLLGEKSYIKGHYDKGKKSSEFLSGVLEIRDIFHDYIEFYQEILNRIAVLCQRLGLTNSLEVCNLFTYLLYNGYLSTCGYNLFQDDGRRNIDGLYFADVARGIGVCLNYTEFLKDLLHTCNYEAASIANHFDLKFVDSKKVANLNFAQGQNCSSFGAFISRFVKSNNHTFNLIKDNGGYYIFDSANYIILRVDDMHTALVINGKGTARLDLPFSQLLCYSTEDRRLIDEVVLGGAKKCPYDRRMFNAYLARDKKLFAQNKNLIDEFYYGAKEYIDGLSTIDRVKTLTRRI